MVKIYLERRIQPFRSLELDGRFKNGENTRLALFVPCASEL
jgi:hypothetical protein